MWALDAGPRLPWRERLRRVAFATGPALRRHWLVAGFAVVILLLVLVADAVIDRPLRSWLEREANARLKGYSVRIGNADFRPWILSGSLFDVVIRQAAHPQPPVARFGRASFDIDWGAIFSGKLVADLEVVRPVIHIDTVQLREEWTDSVPLKDRGWQRVWELYPLKVNRFTVTDGSVTYLDTSAKRSIRLTRMNVLATNIRHVRSRGATYPSPVELGAVVFEKGSLHLAGHADLLRRPHAALNVVARVTGMPLAALGTIVDDYRVRLRGGVLGARGQFEVAPDRYIANLADLDIKGLRVDYVSGAETPRIARAKRAIRQASRYADRAPELRLRARRLTVDGSFGYVSSTEPQYRVFLDKARLRLTNFSNRPEQGESHLALDGMFMGGGPAWLRGVVRPGPGRSDFAVNAEVGRTDLRLLNDLLRAHGKLDVSSGNFAVYSQLQVRDGQVRGYIKPLLSDVEVYDRQDDADDSFFRRLYEKIVEEIARILENQPRDEVASIVDISGPLQDPDASFWQIVGSLLRNAFVQAILPGFEPAHAPPEPKKPSAEAAPPMKPRVRGTRMYALNDPDPPAS